jgi:TPR repeat protein
MANLGALYEAGQGVAQDFAEARAWHEKAAAKGDAGAMTNLGSLYFNGQGVSQDYAEARAWYEKAAAKGEPVATANLENMSIEQSAAEGRYADALRLQGASAAKVEAAETKREGRPGKETGEALHLVSWRSLFARDFAKSLAASDRALPLIPDLALAIDTNRAHALMFLGRVEEARALYLTHRGKKITNNDNKLWEAGIADDFAALRKAGLEHPLMAEIEAALKAVAATAR